MTPFEIVLSAVISPVASSFFQMLFDRLTSAELWQRIFCFFEDKKLDHDLWRELGTRLLTLSAVFSDAEEKQITNPSVKKWLDQLRDVIYDAEDLLDEIVAEDKRKEMEGDNQTDAALALEDLNTRLADIVSRLKHVTELKDILGLREAQAGAEPSTRLPTTCLIDGSEACLRNNDKEEIVNFLLSSSGGVNRNQVPVAAIVGMGGIGKTTLAQFLYNDERLVNHFNLRAWAYVSEEFDVFKVTKTIYESITLSRCGFGDHLNVLQVTLQSRLKGRKFLLILDDVWNETFTDWDLLLKPFSAGAPGSKILVTTRCQSILSTMRCAQIYKLFPLSNEDCWSLFTSHAFRDGDSDIDQSLRVIGKRIVKKCKGLPLAAKALGCLLHSKEEAEEWDAVLKDKLWDLPGEKNGILPALRLSYTHLPSHLKRCFAYCSIFPKGYEYAKEDLVRLWMAEGLVLPPKGKRRMKEVSEQHFGDLLSRSFFQEHSRPDGSQYYVMHDLFNDLAQHVAGEFCFKFETTDGSSEIPTRVRHFSFVPKPNESHEKFQDFYARGSRLRTFLPLVKSGSPGGRLFFSQSIFDNLFLEFRRLRVLSLAPYSVGVLPPSIGKLRHLRYLDLSDTSIKNLPENVGSLYNLETLKMSGSKLERLPGSMQNLTKLEHLDVRRTRLKEMPRGFGSLKNLQLLTNFVANRDSGAKISELRELCHLHGALSVSGLQNVLELSDASEAKLKEKKYLCELILQWTGTGDTINEANVLDHLRPNENLKKLRIEGFGGERLPQWLGDESFSKMVSLHLFNCQSCSSLPAVGQLPSLKELHLENLANIQEVRTEFFGKCAEPFKCLETLTFKGMSKWQNWSSPNASFRSLKQLFVTDCFELTGILPKCLPSLVTLHIRNCGIHGQLQINQYPALQDLYLSSCGELQSLLICSTELKNFQAELTSLQDLHIENCSKLISFMTGTKFPSLKELKMHGCPILQSFCDGGLPLKLQLLSINSCPGLAPVEEWGLHSARSLTSIKIDNQVQELNGYHSQWNHNHNHN